MFWNWEPSFSKVKNSDSFVNMQGIVQLRWVFINGRYLCEKWICLLVVCHHWAH